MFCQECNKPKTICQDTTPTPCECPVQVSTDCILYQADESTCSGIPSGVTLTEYLEQLDTFICNALEEINTGINLINVGTGLGLYKGIDVLGRREIKSLITTSDILTLTANTNDITFSIDEEVLNTFIEENQKTYSADNVGTGVEIYKDSTIVGDNTQFNFRSLTSSGGSVLITQEVDSINIEVDVEPQSVVLQEGTNVTITGTGTDLDPYVISSTDNDTIITLQNGVTTTVNGDGVVTPYSVEVENLQKTINTFPYTLTNSDDKYTLFVANGVDDIVINVPDSLVDNFSVVFIQEGTGSVTIQQSGTATLLYPSTTLQNIIKGQHYWAMVEKKLSTNTYYLLGSLLPI